MKFLRFHHGTAFALAVCVFLFGAKVVRAFDIAEVEKSVSMKTIANGLKVIVYERHDAPVASLVTYANVGAVDDPKGFTGMAHAFEHMAFKGDREIGTKDYAREAKAIEAEESAFLALRLERSKGSASDSATLAKLEQDFSDAQGRCDSFVVNNELPNLTSQAGFVATNAFTAYDQTCYLYNFPQNKLELAMLCEGSRFTHTVLREYHKEVNVVKEERRMRIESNPIGRLLEEFLGASYKSHPYGVPAIGNMSDLGAYSRAEAMEFFRTYYVPNNMCIAVSGDVNPAEVFRFAEKYFGALPRGAEVMPIHTVEPPQLGEKRVVVEDASQPVLLLGYHVPDWSHPDKPALDALVDYLGGGRTSLLYRKLVKETKKSVQVGAFTGLPGEKYPSMVCVYAVSSKDVPASDIEPLMYAEIEKLKSEPMPAGELEAIKARAKGAFINEFNDRQNVALGLAKSEMIGGGWQNYLTQLDRINAVSVEDIMRVAKTYCTRANRTVASIETLGS